MVTVSQKWDKRVEQWHDHVTSAAAFGKVLDGILGPTDPPGPSRCCCSPPGSCSAPARTRTAAGLGQRRIRGRRRGFPAHQLPPRRRGVRSGSGEPAAGHVVRPDQAAHAERGPVTRSRTCCHLIPYEGTNRVERLLARVTLAFFDRYVLGQTDALETMIHAGNVTGTAALVGGGQPPP